MLHVMGHSKSSSRSGSVAAVVAVSLPVILGVAALALDSGILFIHRRQAQTMAEAVSTAAAYQLYLNSSNTSGATSAATALASQYGVSATVNIPPTSGLFANKSGYAQVSLSTSSPRLFSAIWGAGSLSVDASAVTGSGTTPYSTAAILVLSPSGTAMTLSGTTSVTANNGSIIIDSTSNTAVVSSGSPGPSINAPVLDLSGKIAYSGTNPNNATVTNTGQPNTPDPLAGISAPSSSGMTVQSSSKITLSGSTTMTLSPGVYTGGISLSGSSSVTLNSGVYYINGGGIVASGSSSISGSGVFIYNTGGGAINLSGLGSFALSPMTSGAYAGITVFQDRTSTTGATLSGSGNMSNTGTFYFPDANLTLSGTGATSSVGAQIIAKNLTLSGGGSIVVNFGTSVASKAGGFAIVQ